LIAFAEWLVSMDDPDPDSAGFQARRTATLSQIIERARAALEGYSPVEASRGEPS
jgi:hypothetical protein